jgi:large subunit ribosomal protein L25
MKHLDIDVEVRNKTGKGVARKLRSAGRLPAVLYGPQTEPLPISVDAHDFQVMLQGAVGEQILFTMNMSEGDKKRLAMVKELQTHPVNDRIIHVDFYEVDMDRKLHTEVPIKLVGTPVGVEVYKGILEVMHRTVNILCLPMNVPDYIEVDVSNLNIGDAAHISDITPPEGVEITDSMDITLAAVVGSSAGAAEASEEEGEEEVVASEEESEE